ncbi:MAG: helix-turn-helix domain-containing protein [Pelobium sp.]
MKNIILQKMNELIKIQSEILLIIHSVEQAKSKNTSPIAWLDAQDVLQHYHLSQRTLLRLRTRGLLPYYKLEGKIYYAKEELDLLIRNHKKDLRT